MRTIALTMFWYMYLIAFPLSQTVTLWFKYMHVAVYGGLLLHSCVNLTGFRELIKSLSVTCFGLKDSK